MDNVATQPNLLLIDTCGDGAGVAVSRGDEVVASVALSRNGASSEAVDAIKRVLADARCELTELEGVAVVSGPGSFTGVRVGMSAAKGLAEALQIKMVTISRLAVLAVTAKLSDGWAVLDAGRSGLYATEVKDGRRGIERLIELELLREAAAGGIVAVAEERVAALLKERAAEVTVRLRPLRVADSLVPSMNAYRSQARTTALGDANYLSLEGDIYQGARRGEAR